MFSFKALLLAAAVSSVSAAPLYRREVPQEHSHEQFLTSVRTSLNLNNPLQITDPVFALLGNAAAAAGQGKVTDTNCLQQEVADQAFTNAKAANDVDGMVGALIFRALERNTGSVGLASNSCTSVTAVNPEIAAIQQHQDPASTNAASINKAIVLELAKQIASVGGDPQKALLSGTFQPGTIGDPTAAGHTCDTQNDPVGCIFTQNLIVDDATPAEISAAVAGVSATATAASSDATTTAASAASTTAAADVAASSCPAVATVTVTATAAASTSTAAASTSSASSTSAAAAAGQNLQTFTGALGGVAPPSVVETAGSSRPFSVTGDAGATFVNLSAALQRSCSVQHNQCADAANAGKQSFTVGDCDTQNTQCNAAISA